MTYQDWFEGDCQIEREKGSLDDYIHWLKLQLYVAKKQKEWQVRNRFLKVFLII